MVTRDYIDRGDRVIVKQLIGISGSVKDKSYIGKTGVVISNDGFGLCEVKLDDGRKGMFWNGNDLERIGEDN